jgi:hypothetical protein
MSVALLVLGAGAALDAHDIPSDVTVRTFVKPEGRTLRLLVRVPLLAMRDMDYPKRAGATSADLVDLARADATLRDASTLWVADDINVYEDDVKLAYPRVVAVKASLPSDRSFGVYEDALAHVMGAPLPPDTDFFWSQGMLDVLFEYPIQSEQSSFAIEPKLERLGLRTVTILRFIAPRGAVRAFELVGNPGVVRLDPRWYQAARQFVALGFLHVVDGVDLLLFLLSLMMPFRRLGSVIAAVGAFAVAHSITLIASAYSLAADALWFPPLVQTLMAVSILYMALENIVSPQLNRRWMVAFGFGLAYGFAFSFALRPDMQFAGSHALASLLSFTLGVELGHVIVLLVLVPALYFLFRFVVADRLGTIILSALVGHTAWHWLMTRYGVLRQFRFAWPVIDAAFLATAMRWGMLAVIAAAAYWMLANLMANQKYEVGSQKSEVRNGAAL